MTIAILRGWSGRGSPHKYGRGPEGPVASDGFRRLKILVKNIQMSVSCHSSFGLRPASLQFSSLARRLFSRSSCSIGTMAFVSTVKFTAEEIASAPNLEPALEGLLRSNEVHEDIITAFRSNRSNTDRGRFQEHVQGSIRVNTEEKGGGFPHKREWAKLNTVWAQAKSPGKPLNGSTRRSEPTVGLL